MGYKAAAQVLKKAEPLKAKVSAKQQDLLNNLHAWTDQQQLQTIYHQVLVIDLEYALDKKVEQDLWTLGFKNHISALQELTRDKKNPRRSDSQYLLSWCLEAASGFYLSLLQELCSTYDLDLPFRKCGAVFGRLRSYTESAMIVPQSSSCLYICQYCLVHLGDIARYRNQRQQAESFYKHAILVSPNSGHPYNQLALLETSQGDKLSTVFQYVRGIAVKNPFPAAISNLTKTLSAQIDKDNPVQVVQTKLSVNEFISLFLRMHALLHTQTDLKQAAICLKSINATLTALVATQSFSEDQLIMLSIINMYALHHLGKDELTDEEKITAEMALALLAGSLSAFLLPVYTLKNDASILDYYALPAIRLLLLWIKCKPNLLKETEFTSRLQIWPGYCKLLNNITEHVDSQYSNDEYVNKPLLADKELQGFTPFKEAFSHLKFKESLEDIDAEKHLQALRLIDLGKWLCTFDVNGSKLIISNEIDGVLVFEPGCIQPDPTDKLLEEMKSFKVSEPFDVSKLKASERKAGILKPQGSLEKSREERQVKLQEENTNVPKLDNAKMKRVTQNVALQSIYKKLEENKQVKFSPEATEKQPVKKPLLPAPPPSQLVNQSFRMQFPNQNHNLPPPHNNEKEFFSYAPPPQIPMPPQSGGPTPHMENMHYQKPPMDMSNFMMNNMPNMAPNMAHNAMNKSLFNGPPSASMNFPPMLDKPTYNMPFNRDERSNTWWPPPPQTGPGPGSGPPAPSGPGPNWQQPPPQQQYPKDYYLFNQNYSQQGPPPQPQQGPSDMFSPWNNARGPNTNMSMNMPPNQHHSMNMRQAMLNESSKHMMPNNAGPSNQNNINNAPGYSLFNTSSWAPALPQLRSNGDLQRQQSFFGAAPPQSLQQLLEQQSKLKGDT